MADKRRFDLFADFLVQRFGACRVFDVAGGMGRLNEALTARGCTVTPFDVRHKHLPVRYAQRLFTLDEPCDADLVVGLHSDGATRIVVDYAAKHGLGFAVVPCCSDNGMPYNPWRRFLAEYANSKGISGVSEHRLPMDGRAAVVFGGGAQVSSMQ